MKLRQHPYGAAIVLGAIALTLNAAHFIIQVFVVHDPVAEWARDTVENLQSEVWQVFLAAWVWKHFFWHGSPESKDTTDAG